VNPWNIVFWIRIAKADCPLHVKDRMISRSTSEDTNLRGSAPITLPRLVGVAVVDKALDNLPPKGVLSGLVGEPENQHRGKQAALHKPHLNFGCFLELLEKLFFRRHLAFSSQLGDSLLSEVSIEDVIQYWRMSAQNTILGSDAQQWKTCPDAQTILDRVLACLRWAVVEFTINLKCEFKALTLIVEAN